MAISPGKPIKVHQIAIGEIQNWIAEGPSDAQLNVVISALLALFSISWHKTTASPVESRSFTFQQGLITPNPTVRELREEVGQRLIDIYRICSSSRRVSLIASVGSALSPYAPSGVPDDLGQMLIDDAIHIFEALLSLISEEGIAERYEIKKSNRASVQAR